MDDRGSDGEGEGPFVGRPLKLVEVMEEAGAEVPSWRPAVEKPSRETESSRGRIDGPDGWIGGWTAGGTGGMGRPGKRLVSWLEADGDLESPRALVSSSTTPPEGLRPGVVVPCVAPS